MKEEKIYSRVNDAEEIVKELCEKQKELLWQVKPEIVMVVGVENKTRSEKQKAKEPVYTRLKAISGVEKEVLKLNAVNTRFIIEVYWEEWLLKRSEMRLKILRSFPQRSRRSWQCRGPLPDRLRLMRPDHGTGLLWGMAQTGLQPKR